VVEHLDVGDGFTTTPYLFRGHDILDTRQVEIVREEEASLLFRSPEPCPVFGH